MTQQKNKKKQQLLGPDIPLYSINNTEYVQILRIFTANLSMRYSEAQAILGTVGTQG